ncbi:MAG TPA: SRPBCC family protein [Blastocatellia bacterium]|nr:SRPBCC family protein [Blastocatellia bacterium]
MRNYVLERTQVVECSLAEAFEFFSDAYNLEKITPSFLKFRIFTPRPIEMKAGTLIDYRLSIFGVPFHWQTLIEKWEEGRCFVDSQVKGPYTLWCHTHLFEEIGPNITLVRDYVEYRVPYGLFGRLVHTILIKRMLKQIFDFRADAIARILKQ